MKEKVDRILNGETVDIAGDGADYYLSVLQDNDKYKIGFVNPNYVIDSYQRLGTKQMKEAGNLLIELANELDSRKKFVDGDKCISICPDGNMYESYFNSNDSGYVARVAFGNVFKTWEEARKNVLKAVERDRPIKPRKNKTFTHLRICPVCGCPVSKDQ